MTSTAVLALTAAVALHLLVEFPFAGPWGSSVIRHGQALRQLLRHLVAVTLAMSPFAIAYGLDGVLFVVVIVSSHALVDPLRRLADDRAVSAATSRGAGAYELPTTPAWVPARAGSLGLAEVAHFGVISFAWWLWLAHAPPTPFASSLAAVVVSGRDPAGLATLLGVASVTVALVIANTYFASRLVLSLAPPLGRDQHAAATNPSPQMDIASAAVGVLERLLIAALVMASAEEAAALMVAAKELSRRLRVEQSARFAEHYLIGTFASVSIAVVSGYLARFALEAIFRAHGAV